MTAIALRVRSTDAAAGARPARIAVPWSTVLPLALVLGYADGFWATSLRGAVGAVGRAQGPFSRWWHESTALLPLFALVVLAALTLARRWVGDRPRRRDTVLTAVLVALAGTVAGVAVLAANAAFDYHVQSEQIRMMATMGGNCANACQAEQQHETLLVHVRSVLYVSRWILLTNLALVAWMVPLLGGRVRLVRWVRSGGVRSRAAGLRLVLAGGLIGAAAIHAAVVHEHLAEWPAAGGFFIALALGEAAVAAAVVLRPARWPLGLALALSVGPLLIWTYSRAFGLPFGPDPGEPEAVGVPDVLSCGIELATAVTAALLLRLVPISRRPAGSAHAYALFGLALLTATAIGLAATGSIGFTLFDGSTMRMAGGGAAQP